jgi:hypothetical protein
VKDRIENGTYKYCRMFGQTGLWFSYYYSH